jgi:hypothetical protein
MITLRDFVLRFALPAGVLFFAAFWCGAQANVIFALTGFLACFVIAVSLLVEGWKKYKKKSLDMKDD